MKRGTLSVQHKIAVLNSARSESKAGVTWGGHTTPQACYLQAAEHFDSRAA